MAKVVVTPQTFTMVSFDAARIAELTAQVADKIGLPADAEIRVEVDEGNPLGRSSVTCLDPITLTVQGGAFENPKVPRTLNEAGVIDVVSRLLHRTHDRLDPAFGDVPADGDLTLQQHTAWDSYALGRGERLGFAPQRPRRQYHFRNRHGFTDVADAVFDRLWNASGLTWADIDAACAETAAAQAPAA